MATNTDTCVCGHDESDHDEQGCTRCTCSVYSPEPRDPREEEVWQTRGEQDGEQ